MMSQMMKKMIVLAVLLSVIFVFTGKDSSALTFEFNKDKPGIKTFALKYLRFTVDGENIISKFPATFYIISVSPDDIPVLAAKVGKIDGKTGIGPYLEKIAGGKISKSITGTHKEKIVYNPNRPFEKKMLSSYAVWNEWVFIGNKKETVSNILKPLKSPADIAKTDKAVSSIKGWSSAGMKIWADNTDQHLSKLLDGQKNRILIPLIRDPKKVQILGGAFTLSESNEMKGTLFLKPVNPQATKDLEGDVRFVGETIKRRLTAVKTPYNGKVSSSDSGIFFEATIGNYMSAQGQIVQTER
ncbi:MAG: hypothetical protein HZA08_05440 [Nitrospirae bacterium]|nr:hypothetical protein [Nitrospirota bacterium]